MIQIASPRLLRAVLWADAVSCAGTALLQLLAAPALAEATGLSAGLLIASGLLLVGVVAFASYLASCDPIPRGPVWVLIAGNWAWVGACLALLLDGAAGTAVGQAYLIMQIVAVAVIAELEWIGLRASRANAWA